MGCCRQIEPFSISGESREYHPVSSSVLGPRGSNPSALSMAPSIITRTKCFFFLVWLLFLTCVYFWLGLCCRAWAFSSSRVWASQCSGLSLHRAQALGHKGFRSHGPRAWLLRSMWGLPRPGIEPVSPAAAGRFLTAGPPEKSKGSILNSSGRPRACPLTPVWKQSGVYVDVLEAPLWSALE